MLDNESWIQVQIIRWNYLQECQKLNINPNSLFIDKKKKKALYIWFANSFCKFQLSIEDTVTLNNHKKEDENNARPNSNTTSNNK